MTGGVRFERPASLGEALGLLAAHGEDARAVAGSTAVSIMLRNGLIRPSVLVALGGIGGLRGISVGPDAVELGALVTHRQVELHAGVRAAIPALVYTFAAVANPRVRNAATVGGVVAEADYASDPPATLIGLGADIVAEGPAGRRTIPASAFFVAFYETALRPGELVTAVRVPMPAAGTSAVYRKYVSRSSEDRPCVGVFASCRPSAGGGATWDDVRVAVGAAGETPARFPDLEAAASGTDLGDDIVATIADGYAARIDTLDDVRGSAWYRTEMVRVWVRRALDAARDQAQ